jgi:F-type H+-transporting ATPase subunit delta
MAEQLTLARPYAVAAFKSAAKTNGLSQWSVDLEFLAQIAVDSALLQLIDNPKLSKLDKAKLLSSLCENRVSAETANLLAIMTNNNKFKLLPKVATIFEQLKADHEGYVNVEMITAFPLTKSDQNKYITVLETKFKRKVNPTVVVDKALIGGVIAKAGDKVIDGSIQSQLHQLAKRL